MTLVVGTRLGPYEIVSPLGAGGMGEVYRARDTRLDRTVAVKVLNAELVANPALRGRFEREAKIISQLNHPNICTLHDVGSDGGTDYIVMEYLEGETLADRIRRGPLPLDQTVKIGCEIAEALEKAHRAGIVHRDLKPGNVMLTKSGTKLLDFGLAKPATMSAVAGSGPAPMFSAAMTAANSESPLTSAGMVVGTIQYMSPEQLQGTEADARSDIFALGSVLYEMVTGRRAFEGKSQLTVASSILEKDPAPVTALRTSAPAALAHVIDGCLNKDPEQRWQSAGDIGRELAWAGKATTEAPAKQGRTALVPILGAAAAVLLIATIGLVFAQWSKPTSTPKSTVRLSIPLPPGQEIVSYPAITRDGRTVAYVTQQGAEDSQLYLRDLSSSEPRAVAGASGAKQPFFSPDGKWIAFFAQGQLLKAEVSGGTPIRLADATYSFGGTWNEDNTILYTTSLGSGLLRVPAGGGTPESVTKPDGGANGYAHVFPQALPGGRKVLFNIWGKAQGGAVLSLDTGRWEMVLPNTGFGAVTFVGNGGTNGRLVRVDEAAGVGAAPFDAAHPQPTSIDASILSNVYYESETESLGWLAVSDTGTAVYAAGNPSKTSLVWVERDGRTEALPGGENVYREAVVSPDGSKAVVRYGLDLWVHDLQRGTHSRLTVGSGSNILPLWSRDGTRIIFASNRSGDWDIYSQAADGSRAAEVLLKRPYDQFPLSLRADGTLSYVEVHPKTGRDLWILSPEGKSSALRVTPFNETQGEFSPGPGGAGWIAYTSDESGRNEIYVERYPGGQNRTAVSTGGGILPRWSPDGKDLFYVSGDAVVSVAMRPDGSFGEPRRLFDRSDYLLNYRFHSYSVSPDGKRFLMIRRDPGSVPRQLKVILNWNGESEPTGQGNK